MEFILKLKDDGIYEFASDSEAWGGCETCNYGSHYINEFEIYCSKLNIYFKTDQMYEHAMSESFLMKLFIAKAEHFKTLTEEELAKELETLLREKFEEEVEELEFKVLPKGEHNLWVDTYSFYEY